MEYIFWRQFLQLFEYLILNNLKKKNEFPEFGFLLSRTATGNFIFGYEIIKHILKYDQLF